MVLRYRHVYLLGSLILMVLVRPFLDERLLGGALDVFFVVTLIACVLTCAVNRRQAVIGIGLAIVVLIARWWPHFTGGAEWLSAYPGVALIFFVYVTVLMLREVFLGTRRVTTDTICGAVSVYLLMGLIWTFAYVMLENAEPGSFSFAGAELGLNAKRLEDFMGFSFVTLTTLGYGNIVPVTQRADALATTEAIMGQMYLTVLVARLVAMHVTASGANGGGEKGQGEHES